MSGRTRHVEVLARPGLVRRGADGCTEVQVSVPCATCRNGCCGIRREAPVLALKRAGARGLVPGDEVIVSLSRSEMTRWCLLLFGPALVWILLVVGADLTRASAAADGTLAGVLLAGLVTIPAASSWWLRRRPGADRVKLGLDVQNRVDEAVTQAVKWP